MRSYCSKILTLVLFAGLLSGSVYAGDIHSKAGGSNGWRFHRPCR